MTRAQVNRLVDIFGANVIHGLPIAIEAVANVAVSMHGNTNDTRTPVTPATRVDADNVIAFVARAYGISTQQVREPDKSPYLVAARREIAYRLRIKGFSFNAIGKFIGRDHSTLITGCRRFEQLQPELAKQIREGAASLKLVAA